MSTLTERVLEWTQTYCDSLTENYKQHSIRMYQGSDSDYSKRQLESVNNGTANLTNFVIKNGRKYYKTSAFSIIYQSKVQMIFYTVVQGMN